LLEKYNNARSLIDEEDSEKQSDFWLDDLLSDSFKETSQGSDQLNSSLLLLMIIAFIAGLISFASPCTLPILPAYIAYAFKSSKHNLKLMTLAFFLGLSVVFSFLGMSASFIGGFLKSNIATFSKIAGATIIFFGAYTIFGKGFTGLKIKTNKPTNYLGSFFFGAGFGVAWTPCIGPILVAILLVASTVDSMFKGGLLLFIYGFGLALPLFILSIYLDKLNKKSRLWKFIEGRELKIFGFKIHRNSLISGLLFLTIGYLIYSQKLFVFNQYLAGTGLYTFIFKVEEILLRFIN
jgi:cytochrome c-type biogenesis protein